jgi:hypothetical protein
MHVDNSVLSYVASIKEVCNECFMAESAKSSPLSELCSALPWRLMRLREMERFIAVNDCDVTTHTMRDLTAEPMIRLPSRGQPSLNTLCTSKKG